MLNKELAVLWQDALELEELGEPSSNKIPPSLAGVEIVPPPDAVPGAPGEELSMEKICNAMLKLTVGANTLEYL